MTAELCSLFSFQGKQHNKAHSESFGKDVSENSDSSPAQANIICAKVSISKFILKIQCD